MSEEDLINALFLYPIIRYCWNIILPFVQRITQCQTSWSWPPGKKKVKTMSWPFFSLLHEACGGGKISGFTRSNAWTQEEQLNRGFPFKTSSQNVIPNYQRSWVKLNVGGLQGGILLNLILIEPLFFFLIFRQQV